MKNTAMNNNALKKALTLGVPAGALAWLLYGVLTSLFDDDSIFEQMFDSSGIFFGVVMMVIAAVYYYRNALKAPAAEAAETAEQAET